MIWGNSPSRTKSWNSWFPDCRTLILRTADTTPTVGWRSLVCFGWYWHDLYIVYIYIIIINYICYYIHILLRFLWLLVGSNTVVGSLSMFAGCAPSWLFGIAQLSPIVSLFSRFYTHWISVEFSVVASNTLCMPYVLGKYWFVMVGLACIKHGGCLWFVSN